MLNRLCSFLGGIARKNGFKTIAIGGTENHVHVLLSLPATMPLAKAVQLLKGGSSKWLNETINPALNGNRAMQRSASAFRTGKPRWLTSTDNQNIIASAILRKSSLRS
jgi:REP element-mobilizing transposase RayT